METEGKHTPEQELDPEWQEAINAGIADALENYELAEVVSISPLSLTQGMDEREFHQLSPQEQKYLREIFFREVGYVPNEAEPEEIYQKQPPELEEGSEYSQGFLGTAEVQIFRTRRSDDDNMFLHKATYSEEDGRETVDYYVAPKDFR